VALPKWSRWAFNCCFPQLNAAHSSHGAPLSGRDHHAHSAGVESLLRAFSPRARVAFPGVRSLIPKSQNDAILSDLVGNLSGQCGCRPAALIIV
jgi:hypothetical protein